MTHARLSTYPHQITDGLLNLEVNTDKDQIVEHLSRRVVSLARHIATGQASAESMEKVFRCSRMCWELIVSGKMTDLDLSDVLILLDLPLSQSSGTENLFNTLNQVKARVTKSELDPKTIHGASMGLVRSMTS